MFSVKDVADRLSLSPSKVYRLIEERELSHHKIGGAIRISEEQLSEFLQKTTRERRTDAPPSVRPHPYKLKHIHR